MQSPVSSLSLRDNLISKLLDEREVMECVYASDYGYNKIQQLTDLLNPYGSIRVENPKFEDSIKTGCPHFFPSGSRARTNFIVPCFCAKRIFLY